MTEHLRRRRGWLAAAATMPASIRALSWLPRSLTTAVVDLAPLAAIFALCYAAGWILPVVGGPRVLFEIPLPIGSLPTTIGATLAMATGFLLHERVGALVRATRDPGMPLAPLATAAARFGMRRTHRIVAAAGGAFLVRSFMPLFLGFKNAIPRWQTWGPWDLVFMRWDQALHGGRHPWELLHPLLGHAGVTIVLDRLYYLWFPMSVIGFLLLVFCLTGSSRCRFLLAFGAIWSVLGIVVATATASVGPCYVSLLAGIEDPYRELMRYLGTVDARSPLQALTTQAELWQSYRSGSRTLYSGIAAMPSLHVAVPALFAVASWRISRWASLAFWSFTLLIFLGSVHLAWHYAVDGYASIVLVLAVWWASGGVARWWIERARPRTIRAMAIVEDD